MRHNVHVVYKKKSGIIVGEERAHNANTAAGRNWMAGRFFANTGTNMTSPTIVVESSGGTVLGTISSASTVRSGSIVTQTGRAILTVAGSPGVLDLNVGSPAITIATVSLTGTSALSAGDTVDVTWTITFSFSGGGNYDADFITAVYETGGSSDIGQLWSSSKANNVAVRFAQASLGTMTSPDKISHYRMRIFKIRTSDYTGNQPPPNVDDDNPVNLEHDSNVACSVSGTNNSRTVTFPFPGNGDSGAFRYRWTLLQGSNNNAFTGPVDLSAYAYDVFGEIPTAGNTNTTGAFVIR